MFSTSACSPAESCEKLPQDFCHDNATERGKFQPLHNCCVQGNIELKDVKHNRVPPASNRTATPYLREVTIQTDHRSYYNLNLQVACLSSHICNKWLVQLALARCVLTPAVTTTLFHASTGLGWTSKTARGQIWQATQQSKRAGRYHTPSNSSCHPSLNEEPHAEPRYYSASSLLPSFFCNSYLG